MSDKKKPLTNKQKAFVAEYLKCWNATKAALNAGYSEKTAYSIGWENLRKPEIQEEITVRLDEVHMSAEEALKLQADIARGDMAELMDVTSMGFSLDMAAAKEKGLTRLIKKVKQKTTTYIAKKESEEDREVTELEIELYDAQAAIRDVLKIHGKFTEKVDLSNSDGSLKQESNIDQIAQRIDQLLKIAQARKDANAG